MRGGGSTLRPRRAKRALMCTSVRRRPLTIAAGAGSRSSSMYPLGSGSRPPETTRSMTTGCSSIVRRAPTVR